jgi:Carboxypeptidase regulatory-like domain
MTRISVGCVLTLICASLLSGAPQFVIAGRVTDSEGAAIAKARVLVHWDPSGSKVGLTGNVGTAQDADVLTDSNGDYSANVPPGFYDVFISAPMFTPTAAKVIVKQGQSAILSMKLRLDPLVSKEIGGMEVYSSPNK